MLTVIQVKLAQPKLKMDNFLILLAGVFLVSGFMGCLVSKLPGTPISFLGIIVLNFSSLTEYSTHFFVKWGIIVIAVQGLDYLIPSWGKRKFGGSKKGVWGGLLGLFAGSYFGPWGISLGAIAGALVGELLTGKESNLAARETASSFAYFFVGTVSKLIVSGILLYHYLESLSYLI